MSIPCDERMFWAGFSLGRDSILRLGVILTWAGLSFRQDSHLGRIPAWAVFALLVSILTSLFVAFVILRVWQDPDDQGEHND